MSVATSMRRCRAAIGLLALLLLLPGVASAAPEDKTAPAPATPPPVAAPGADASEVHHGVARDGVHPWLERPLRPVRVAKPVNRNEHVLNDVLRQGGIPQTTVDEPAHDREHFDKELFVGRRVAGLGGGHPLAPSPGALVVHVPPLFEYRPVGELVTDFSDGLQLRTSNWFETR